MRFEICWRSLRDKKRALIGWCIGLALLTLFTMAFWPTIRGNSQFDKLFKKLPNSLKGFVGSQPFTTPAGYLQQELFQYLVPLLFMIYAIGRGADAIAGEEERKTMDLLLSAPVRRSRVVLEKYFAIVIGVAALALVLLAVLSISAATFDMRIGLDKLVAATVGSALLSLAFASIALAVSSSAGKRGLSIATASALATAAFFVNSLAPLAQSLKAAQKLSPFHWYLAHSPLKNGFDFPGLSLLVAVSIIMVALAVIRFERRDVCV
jgi:ABC-2 type transport system permease protein